MSDQSNQQNPFTTRRFILAVIVVGIIAICAVIVIISNFAGVGKTAPSAGGDTPAPTSTAAAPAVDPDPSTCGLKDYVATGTLEVAPATKWELVGTVAAPTDAKKNGPGVVAADGFRSCYSHTPTGALYSAANLMALVSDTSLVKEVADKLVVPGPGRDALLSQAGSTSTTTTRYQVAGFKIDSYSGTKATIDLAVNFSTGQILSFPIQLEWLDGDWKAQATPTGGFTLAPAQLQNLGGYIPWAGA